MPAPRRRSSARAARSTRFVNAAGWDRTQPFVEADQAFLDKVLGINLLGPLRLTRALFPAMIANGGGKIVFVASDAGRVGSLGETPYSAAKGGIIGFTKSLAREGARHKITVNCVCPGPTDTPLFHANPERMREALLKAIPFRRLAKPEDIAGAILYFAGPTSDYVTGQILSRQRGADDGGLGLGGCSCCGSAAPCGAAPRTRAACATAGRRGAAQSAVFGTSGVVRRRLG